MGRLFLFALGLLMTISTPAGAQAKPRRYTDAEIDKVYAAFVTAADVANGSEVRHLRTPVLLRDGNGFNYPSVVFDLVVASTAARETSITLQFGWVGERRPYLSGTARLILEDDVILLSGLNGAGVHARLHVDYPMVVEVVGFQISCELLAKLARCRVLQVVLDDDESGMYAWFPREGLAAFRTLRIEAGCQPARGYPLVDSKQP